VLANQRRQLFDNPLALELPNQRPLSVVERFRDGSARLLACLVGRRLDRRNQFFRNAQLRHAQTSSTSKFEAAVAFPPQSAIRYLFAFLGVITTTEAACAFSIASAKGIDGSVSS
jgi:hypothetical protein